MGDRGGRVIIFEKITLASGAEDYDYLTEFQSHTKRFDTLQNQEIPETVTAIEWLNNAPTKSPCLLVSNQRQIKLFKMMHKSVYEVESAKHKLKKGKGLSIPKRRLLREQTETKLLHTFKTDKE